MGWLLVIAIVVIVVLAVVAAGKGKAGKGSIGFPYQRGKPLFSAAERSFLGALDQAVGQEHRVLGKVRIADVAAVTPGLGASAWRSAFNRIACKHFDFVVCRADDLSVLCVVELDDKSHRSQRARARDKFVAGVCEAIELPLLQIPAQRAYTLTDLRARFQQAIGAPGAAALPAEAVT